MKVPFSDVERTFNVAERNFLLGKSTFFCGLTILVDHFLSYL